MALGDLDFEVLQEGDWSSPEHVFSTEEQERLGRELASRFKFAIAEHAQLMCDCYGEGADDDPGEVAMRDRARERLFSQQFVSLAEFARWLVDELRHCAGTPPTVVDEAWGQVLTDVMDGTFNRRTASIDGLKRWLRGGNDDATVADLSTTGPSAYSTRVGAGGVDTDLGTREALSRVLATIEPLERDLLRAHYGLEGVESLTLDELATAFNLPKLRVSQILSKALRKLRHPLRSRTLSGERGSVARFEAEFVARTAPIRLTGRRTVDCVIPIDWCQRGEVRARFRNVLAQQAGFDGPSIEITLLDGHDAVGTPYLVFDHDGNAEWRGRRDDAIER